jgi:hypothetical protein
MMPPGLRGITSFSVPRRLLREIQSALQEFGLEQQERFVLLTGQVAGPRALVRSAWVPLQFPESHERGLFVTVPGEELRRLNRAWASRREQLMLQVHSHPSVPYHSETDDRFAMVTIEGGLSIVVPLFGFCPLQDFQACAAFRLEDGNWRWLPPEVVANLIQIV